jgi:hypothetical protein
LPADPQASAADFAVGNAAQVPAEQLADGGEHLFHRVEADAADQMDVQGAFRIAHRIGPLRDMEQKGCRKLLTGQPA